MGLRAYVQKQVKYAFKQIGDLKTVATLSFFNEKSFDFATAETVETQPVSLTVKGVLEDERRKGFKNTTLFMFDSTEVNLSEPYDKLIANGVTYKIVPPIINDGYVTYIACSEV